MTSTTGCKPQVGTSSGPVLVEMRGFTYTAVTNASSRNDQISVITQQYLVRTQTEIMHMDIPGPCAISLETLTLWVMGMANPQAAGLGLKIGVFFEWKCLMWNHFTETGGMFEDVYQWLNKDFPPDCGGTSTTMSINLATFLEQNIHL